MTTGRNVSGQWSMQSSNMGKFSRHKTGQTKHCQKICAGEIESRGVAFELDVERGPSIQRGTAQTHHHKLASAPSVTFERQLAIHRVLPRSTPAGLKHAFRNRSTCKLNTAAG